MTDTGASVARSQEARSGQASCPERPRSEQDAVRPTLVTVKVFERGQFMQQQVSIGMGAAWSVCLAAALVVGTASPSPAQSPPPEVITACVTRLLDVVRIVPATETCRSTERRLQWNVAGPRGPEGPPGSGRTDRAPGTHRTEGRSRGRWSQGRYRCHWRQRVDRGHRCHRAGRTRGPGRTSGLGRGRSGIRPADAVRRGVRRRVRQRCLRALGLRRLLRQGQRAGVRGLLLRDALPGGETVRLAARDDGQSDPGATSPSTSSTSTIRSSRRSRSTTASSASSACRISWGPGTAP